MPDTAPSPPAANASNVELAAEIVSAYVAHNSTPATELPKIIGSVHAALSALGSAPAPPVEEAARTPAVPIKKSVAPEYIVCLEDGRRFKSLKRHLAAEYGITPDQYRAKWGLPKDYPMVAPSYAAQRSALAKNMGLGRKAGTAAVKGA